MVLCSPTQHKGHIGEGWLSGSTWLSYVRRKGDLLARSCASRVRVFLGSSASVLSYLWRRSVKDAAVWDGHEMLLDCVSMYSLLFLNLVWWLVHNMMGGMNWDEVVGIREYRFLRQAGWSRIMEQLDEWIVVWESVGKRSGLLLTILLFVSVICLDAIRAIWFWINFRWLKIVKGMIGVHVVQAYSWMSLVMDL